MNQLNLVYIVNAVAFLLLIVGFFYYYWTIDKKYGRNIAIILLIATVALVRTCGTPSEKEIKKLVDKEIKNANEPFSYTKTQNHFPVSFAYPFVIGQRLRVDFWVTLKDDGLYQVERLNFGASGILVGSAFKFDNPYDFVSQTTTYDGITYENLFLPIDNNLNYHFYYNLEVPYTLLGVYQNRVYYPIDKVINLKEFQ